jgi:flagellar biosynthesis protein FlhF
MGLLPINAQKVVNRLQSHHGQEAPEDLAEELQLARAVLRQSWPQPSSENAEAGLQAHVLAGAPGTGKTTCLCKWLVQSVLLEGCSARVWRLDGRTANTAETVNVYCDILGVPLDRAPQDATPEEDLLLVDLPGVNWTDGAALEGLGQQLKGLPSPQLHLVLNAAYETSILLAQVRAFSSLPVTDLVITHLDEERRWGKLWNFVLGTKYSLRFFSAGQNIPGDFFAACPERVLEPQFARK